MRKSLKERILKYIRNQQGWINGGQLERLSLEAGYKASNGSRRCRELVNEGLLERKEENGSVWYKASEPKQIREIRVQGELVSTQKLW